MKRKMKMNRRCTQINADEVNLILSYPRSSAFICGSYSD